MRYTNEKTIGKTIEKIQKLLALASSPNEHEAQSALLKAQELLAKHNLSMGDITNVAQEQAEEVIQERLDVKFTKMRWRLSLATVIADNFRCYAWGNTSCTGNGIGVTFLGKESDVEICKTMYVYAVKFVESNIRRMQRQLNKDGYSSSGVGKSYGMGFVMGLKSQFDKQMQEHQEWGLVLVKPVDVTEAYELIKGGFKKHTNRKQSIYQNYYDKGKKDGEEFAPNAVTTSSTRTKSALLLGQ